MIFATARALAHVARRAGTACPALVLRHLGYHRRRRNGLGAARAESHQRPTLAPVVPNPAPCVEVRGLHKPSGSERVYADGSDRTLASALAAMRVAMNESVGARK